MVIVNIDLCISRNRGFKMIEGDFAFLSGLAGIVCASLLWFAVLLNL